MVQWREDVRTRTQEKQWQEYARQAWDISPTLAIFLPSWLNCSPALVSEVSRLTRANPTKVCGIPQALDYFLSDDMLEKDRCVSFVDECSMCSIYCSSVRSCRTC